MSPMWLTSNSPTAVRTAMCSAVMSGVLDRHIPAAEIDHLGAKLAVDSVQSGFAQLRGDCGSRHGGILDREMRNPLSYHAAGSAFSGHRKVLGASLIDVLY